MTSLEQLIQSNNTSHGFVSEVAANIQQTPSIIEGSTFDIYDLNNYPSIIVKTAKAKHRGTNRSAEIMNRTMEEHKLASVYLRQFIPQTVFIQIDLGKGLEWVQVQEKVEGVPYYQLDSNEPHVNKVMTKKLEQEFEDFLLAYKQMRNAGFVIEDQLMISFDTSRIYTYDTNNLKYPMLQRDLYIFEDLFDEKCKSLDPRDVWEFLKRGLGIEIDLDFNNEESYFNTLREVDVTKHIYEKLEEKFTEEELSPVAYIIESSFVLILNSFREFPPKYFRDNEFTSRLRKSLNL